jgi:hypothetical protein
MHEFVYLTVEVFEPVLDEEGDTKNMAMYMVAETIGGIPLELKWWTGRTDANNNAVCEMGEMAIADWGDLHRNTTKQTQTKNRNATHTNTIHTNTPYLITKPPQTKALLNTTNLIATQPNTLFSIKTYLTHPPLTHNNPAHTFLSPRQILTHSLFVTQALATGPPELKGERDTLHRTGGRRYMQETKNREDQEVLHQTEHQKQRKGRRIFTAGGPSKQLRDGEIKTPIGPLDANPRYQTLAHPALTPSTPTYTILGPTTHLNLPNTPHLVTIYLNISSGACSTRRLHDIDELDTPAIWGTDWGPHPLSRLNRE